MHHAVSVSAAVLTSVWLAPAAQAQLTATSGVGRSLYNDVELFTELPGGEFQAGSFMGKDNVAFRLEGDGMLELDLDFNGSPYRAISISGWQQFDVGPWPTEITPQITTNFKIVNAGGPDDAPSWETVVYSQLTVWESGTFDVDRMEGDLGNWAFNRRIENSLVGNGFSVFDRSLLAEPYVLMPGVNYTMAFEYTVVSFIDGLDGFDPAASVWLEAGGVSEFGGLEISLNPRTVPAPAGVLALLGLLAVGRRRG